MFRAYIFAILMEWQQPRQNGQGDRRLHTLDDTSGLAPEKKLI